MNASDASPWGSPTPSRALRLTGLLLLAGVVFAASGGTAGARTGATLPPVPACFSEGTGYGSCDGIEIPAGAAVVNMTAENRKTSFYLTGPAPLQSTKAVACGDLGCVYNHLNWTIGLGASAVLGCGANQTVCDVRVAPGSGWVAVYVRQNNDPATLYAIYNTGKKDGATIYGYVKDKDGNGFSGAAVDAYGVGSNRGEHGFAVSGDQGYYAMEVHAGSYKVVPSGGIGGKKPPTYDPDSSDVSVQADAKARADFKAEVGLDVALTLSRTTALADGYTVITGEVVTTQYGKPKPSVQVSLRPQASVTADVAVASGARATICASNNGARIWPAGSLSAPVGSPVTITTDANGIYHFSITVGTVPGTFTLTAWALDGSGHLVTTDVPDVSDEQTVTLSAPGTFAVGNFLNGLQTLVRSDSELSKALETVTTDPSTMALALSKSSVANTGFGGLAYSVVNGAAGGPALLIYQDASPPVTNSSSQVTAGRETLVLSPGQWAGNAIPGFVQGTALPDFLKSGKLQNAPTFTEWSSGATVKGWNLTKNSASLYSQSFEYLGWPYPAVAGSGACN